MQNTDIPSYFSIHEPCSYWLKSLPPTDNRECSDELQTHFNVAIIGCGMTGVSCAYWLSQNNIKDVIAFDSRGISEGATGTNGGLMWPGLNPPFIGSQLDPTWNKTVNNYSYYPKRVYDTREHLKEFEKVYLFDYRTMELMENYFEDNNIPPSDVDFRYTGAVALAKTQDELDTLTQQCMEANELFSKYSIDNQPDFEIWDAEKCRSELKTNVYIGGMFQRRAGQFYPAKFVHSLVKSIKDRVTFKTHTPIVSVIQSTTKNGDDVYTIRTSEGAVYTANKVVYATNAWTPLLRKEYNDAILACRGQCISTSPVKFKINSSICQVDECVYLMQREDGRIVVGGMRYRSETKEENTFDDSTSHEQIAKGLREFLQKSFPELEKEEYTIENDWTGIMGFTKDHQPLVGEISRSEYIAAGFTGHGMPRCFGVAKMIADMVAGKFDERDRIDTFRPERFFNLVKQ